MTEAQTTPTPLLEFLRETGAACPMCRYNLKGVASDRCPECGYELRLAIARPVTGFGWWLAGLFGLASTAGMLWLILWPSIPRVAEVVNNPDLTILVQRGFVPASDLPNWRAVFPVSVGLLVCFALMGLIIGSRRRLVTWRMKWQVICGTTLLLLPLIMLIMVAALTR